MLRPLLISSLLGSNLACQAASPPSSPSATSPPIMQSHSLTAATSNAASIQTVTLIAQQEPLPPLGSDPEADRPIGFASIFLTLENPSDRIQTLELLEVKVVAADNNEIQLSSDEVQTIKLMPLEKAVLDIQLNNQEGYGAEGAVKAIATYRLATLVPGSLTANDTVHSIESPAVEIR